MEIIRRYRRMVRTPEEQEHFLTRGRFGQTEEGRHPSASVLATFALVYWLFAAIAFLLNFFVGFFLTLPWSYLVISLRMRLAASNSLVAFVNSKEGGFLVFPVLCGGLNILVLFALMKLLISKAERRVTACLIFTLLYPCTTLRELRAHTDLPKLSSGDGGSRARGVKSIVADTEALK